MGDLLFSKPNKHQAAHQSQFQDNEAQLGPGDGLLKCVPLGMRILLVCKTACKENAKGILKCLALNRLPICNLRNLA